MFRREELPIVPLFLSYNIYMQSKHIQPLDTHWRLQRYFRKCLLLYKAPHAIMHAWRDASNLRNEQQTSRYCINVF